MPFNNVISRADAAALIPQEVSNEIITGIAASNPLLQLATRLPNMSSNQKRLPVMSALALAYFVNGDTGLKQTSEVNWANVFIDAEEIACIVPIPEAVLDDASYDIWGQVRPQIVEAMNLAIADAIINGTNIPATWTTNLGAAGLIARATAAGHVVTNAAFADTYDALMSESGPGLANGVLMLLEADGFMATGHLAESQGPLAGKQVQHVQLFALFPMFPASSCHPSPPHPPAPPLLAAARAVPRRRPTSCPAPPPPTPDVTVAHRRFACGERVATEGLRRRPRGPSTSPASDCDITPVPPARFSLMPRTLKRPYHQEPPKAVMAEDAAE